MPIGSRHDETGWIAEDGFWLVLRRDDGGRWRLDPTRKLRRYVGKRVRLIGERVGFDELLVRIIEAI